MGNFSNLPSEIMLHIFTRLPAESVLESKLVCKSWRIVIQHPSFIQMHTDILLSNHPSAADSGKLSFAVVMNNLSDDLPRQFHYLEYDIESSSHRIKKMNLNPPFKIYSFLGSCNGLICLKGLPNHYTMDNTTSASYVLYICNPITREVVTLPQLDRRKYYHLVEFMLYGFGYVASIGEYKVVRLYTFNRDRKVAQIDVYTLGSGRGWRDAGRVHSYQDFNVSGNAVFADGFLHWDIGNERTAVYDLENEFFLGYSDFEYGFLWPVFLGGHLCGLRGNKEDTKITDVWLLKKTKGELFGWCKDFSLVSTNSYDFPLARTSGGTVLGHSDTKLNLYDLKSASSRVLEDFGRTIRFAMPHVNTFVSLKALGEENTKALE